MYKGEHLCMYVCTKYVRVCIQNNSRSNKSCTHVRVLANTVFSIRELKLVQTLCLNI